MTEICAECGQPVHPGATVIRGERGPELANLGPATFLPDARSFGKSLSAAMEDEPE